MNWTHQARRLYRFRTDAGPFRGLPMAQIRVSQALFAPALLALLAQPAARAQEEKLGTVDFPISCSAEAQTQFNRATAMLHSFFFPETVKAFKALAAQEPSCAMAYWGLAISQRP